MSVITMLTPRLSIASIPARIFTPLRTDGIIIRLGYP